MTANARLSAPKSGALFDELLVIMVQRGDGAALERLYARWNSRLIRAAYRYTGDREIARDLAQECWIGILSGIGGLRDPARFRSFAFAILHRRGADYLRVAMRRREVAEEAEHAAQPAHTSMLDDGLALGKAFAALPPDQRLTAHLHFVEGLTLDEIASVQSIPTGTAKSRLFHARRKLKAALTEFHEGELT